MYPPALSPRPAVQEPEVPRPNQRDPWDHLRAVEDPATEGVPGHLPVDRQAGHLGHGTLEALGGSL